MSRTAAKRIRGEIRSWRLHHRTSQTLKELAGFINPIVQGWINYYGRFYRSELSSSMLTQINRYLIRWVVKKSKTMRTSYPRATQFLGEIAG